MESMLRFVLSHKPDEWVTADYNESYKLFDLDLNSEEYMNISTLFDSTAHDINSIQRVQNPFQYGRFKLRQEMLNNMAEVKKHYNFFYYKSNRLSEV